MVDANLTLLAFDRCRYMKQNYSGHPSFVHTSSNQQAQSAAFKDLYYHLLLEQQ
jgi:hypothetical protein